MRLKERYPGRAIYSNYSADADQLLDMSTLGITLIVRS